MKKYLRSALRLFTCAMVIALWAVGLWVLLPLAQGAQETRVILAGLTLLTLVHTSFMLLDLYSEKRAHHQERLRRGAGSSEQTEAHQAEVVRTGWLELIALTATAVSVLSLILFRFTIS